MKMKFVNWKKYTGGLMALCLCAALESHGQGIGGLGGFGGFGGVGNNTTQNRSSTTYNSAGGVGNAIISVNPDTSDLTINADEETTKAILEVIHQMDRAQPQ